MFLSRFFRNGTLFASRITGPHLIQKTFFSVHASKGKKPVDDDDDDFDEDEDFDDFDEDKISFEDIDSIVSWKEIKPKKTSNQISVDDILSQANPFADKLGPIRLPKADPNEVPLTSEQVAELPDDEKIAYLHRIACEEGKETYQDPISELDVTTAIGHLTRGYCCEDKKCRHCPYGYVSAGVFRSRPFPSMFRGIDLESSVTQCMGCGSDFQSADESKPGYLPEKKVAELEGLRQQGRLSICQRCYKLKHYGELAALTMQPEAFRRKLDVIRRRDCVVVKLVDIFDFQGSFLTNLWEIVGHNPVILVANKADLLPTGAHGARVEAWLRKAAKDLGITRLESVHLVSAQTGLGIASLAEHIQRLSRGADIFVIGAANVGKSTLINRIIASGGGSKDKLITTSPVPGTTLNLISISLPPPEINGRKVGKASRLYDTPGLLMPHQITRFLATDDLKRVLPRKKLKPKTYRLTEGQSVLYGALARFDHVSGPPLLVTCFMSAEVVPHVCNTHHADDVYEQHAGGLLSPPVGKERVKALPPQQAHTFVLEGRQWDHACADLVVSGLGWLSVTTGLGTIEVRVLAPENIAVTKRQPLMPFDVPNPDKKPAMLKPRLPVDTKRKAVVRAYSGRKDKERAGASLRKAATPVKDASLDAVDADEEELMKGL